jgi:hypothetical protein
MNRPRARQYTIRRVPLVLDAALRRRARREHKSLNEVALEALRRAVDLPEVDRAFDDLDSCIGTWEDDPEFEAVLAAQDRVDEALWR